jgi:geranylgeranyl diphosphate synthase type I
VFDLMSTQLMVGQFLDVLDGVRPPAADPVEQARRVIRFKTVQYTVARPLQLGGALAGADDSVLAGYQGYAERIGEAFQLRDDLLGVFGDPALTGKPAGDDLREGKQTVLVALARQRATQADLAEFDAGFGNPELSAAAVLRLRDVLIRTAAVERVEEMIVRLEEQALAVLDGSDIAEPARSVLAELAASAVRRQA